MKLFSLKILVIVLLVSGMLAIADPAIADWDKGDSYKMHWPQLPDPQGWDIDMTKYVLADDWQCIQMGPVSDIHFWLSMQGQQTSMEPPPIQTVKVSIHDDIASGPGRFSIPGNLLWERTFTTVRIAGPWTGIQGWDTPELNSKCQAEDHRLYWQVNLTDIVDPFHQELDKIYWLDLNVAVLSGTAPVGWKTTLDPFRDHAVYATAAGGWELIAVCTDNHPTDLAFVITPEPATLCLLALGGLALIRRRRRV